MQVIRQYQVVRHAQAVRLHGVVRPIVISPNLLVVVIAYPIFRYHAATTSQLWSGDATSSRSLSNNTCTARVQTGSLVRPDSLL